MKTKKKTQRRPITVCQISVYSDRPRFRIEGDYVYPFYRRLKELVPVTRRSYIEQGRYWLVDKLFFSRIFELAYEHFDKIIEFASNNRVYEYITGIAGEPEAAPSFCKDRAKSFWEEQAKREKALR